MNEPVRLKPARSWRRSTTAPTAQLGAKTEDGIPLIKGRKLTSISNAEESGYALAEVPFLLEDTPRAEGGEYSSVEVWPEKVVVDGKLMTGQNPPSGGPLAKAIVEALR